MDDVENQLGVKLPSVMWKAASAAFAANACEATAVLRAAGVVWTMIEEPILTLRGIAPTFAP